ncbi:MAG: Autotransporter-associated beta strand repeat-containing protein, partial [Verrucomicrobia bacterium]
TQGTITLAGGLVQNGTLTATGTAFVAQAGEVSAILAGTQGLVKDGAGVLTLSAANAYTGGTTVAGGSLLLTGGEDRLSRAGFIATIGGVLDLGGNGQRTQAAIIFAGGLVQNGTLTATGTAFVGQAGAVSAILAGTQGLVKTGGDALTLSAVNTFTGGTRVEDGSLRLSGGDDRLSLTGFITSTGGVLDLGGNKQNTVGTITFAGGLVQNGTLTATGAAFVAQSGTVSAVLAGTQGLVKDGAGSLTLNAVSTYTGGTSVGGGSLLLVGGDDRLSISGSITTSGGVLDLGGNGQTTQGTITFAGGLVQNGTLTATGAAFIAQGGTVSAILGGTQGLVKDAAASLTLSAVNTYTGGTTVAEGSLLLVGGNDRLSTTGSIMTSGGVLDLGGNEQTTLGTITFAGGLVQNGTFTATRTGFVAQGGTVSAILAGTQGLVKIGSGAVTLSASNTYSGGTTLLEGTLFLAGGDDRLSSSGSITTSGGVLDLGGNMQTTLGTVTFAGGEIQNGTLVAIGSAFVAQNGTVRAILGGTVGFVQGGTGTTTLSGQSVYTGGTTVNGGLLVLAGGDDRLSTSGDLLTVGGALDLGGNSQSTAGLITFAGGVVKGGTLIATGRAFVAQSGTVSAILAGSQGLLKIGADTFTPIGVNTYSGGTTLQMGRFNLNTSGDGLGSSIGTGLLTINGGTLVNTSGSKVTVTTNNPQLWNTGFVFAAGSDLNLGTGTVTLGGSPTVTVEAGTLSVGGRIAGSGFGLIKTGDGNLQLSGLSTFDGGTTVAAGILTLGSSAETLSTVGAITVMGGKLDLSGGAQSTSGALTFAGGTVQNGVLAATRTAFDGRGGFVSAVLAGTQGLTKTTSGVLALSGENTFEGGVTLYAGLLNLNAPGSSLGSSLGVGMLTIKGGTLGNSSGVGVTIASNNRQLWDGDFSFSGSDDLNLGTGVVTLGRSLAVNVSNKKLSIGGSIEGSGFGLTKLGADTLILSASSLYDGGTNLIAGSLILSGGSDRLSRSGAITVIGGVLDLGGNSQSTSGMVTLSGGAVQGGALIATGTAFLAEAGAVSAVLGGTQGLVKNGTGTISLKGSNTFAGPVNINGGTVALFGGAALSDTVSLTIGVSGRLALNADETIAALSGSGLLSLGIYKLTTNASEDSIFDGALSGSGVIEKLGTGVLTLSGSSPDFTGILRISGGTAMLGVGAPLGEGSVELSALGKLSLISNGSLGAISGAGNVLLAGATLTLDGPQNTTLTGAISGVGAVFKAGSGELTLTNSNAFSGGFKLQSGAVRLGNNAALGSGTVYLFGGTLSTVDAVRERTISNFVVASGSSSLGDLVQSAALTLSGTVSLSGSVEWNVQSPVFVLSGVTAEGAFGVTKAGGSTLTLGGASTYSGGTTIAAGSLVLLPGTEGLSTVGSITSSGGVFELGGNLQTTLGRITFSGGIVQNGTLTASGTAFVGQSGTVSTILAGTQGLVKETAAKLTLSGVNTYTGGTILREGSLVLSGGNDRLSLGGAISLLGGVLDLGANSQSTSGAITIAGATIQNGTLIANGGAIEAQAGTVTAVLVGTQGLTKTSSGVLTLTGANRYTGPTAVNAGSLRIEGAGTLDQSTVVSVANRGTLNYFPTNAGTLRVGALSLASGATIGLGWGASIAASGTASASGVLTLGMSGLFVSGQAYTVLTGGAGSSLDTAHYTLTGTDAYDYSLVSKAGAVEITPRTSSELIAAYWVGGRSLSGPAVWNVENWATDVGGSILTARTPTSLSTVFLSAATALGANQAGMTLGGDTAIDGLVASSVFAMSLLDDRFLLQVGTGGISVRTGAGSLSLAGAINLGGSQTWSNSGAGRLMVSGNVNLGRNALLFSGSSAIVISGSVSGAGGLSASNTSGVRLGGENRYTGGTTVRAGSLELFGGDNRLSPSGAITGAGGILDLGGNSQSTIGTITFSGGTVQNGTLKALGNAFDAQAGSVSAVLAGSQALVKTSAATVTLGGANTYSGGTTLQQGQLNLNNGGSISNSSLGIGPLTILGGSLGNTSGSSVTLATQNLQLWNGDFAFAGTSDLNLGMGAVNLGVSPTVTVHTGTLTVGGLVSGGSFGITKAGQGTLILAGGYSYSGPTQINGGRLEIGSSVTIGTGQISLADDALLVFQLGADLIIPNKIVGGRVLTLNPLYNVFWEGGTTAQVDLIVPKNTNQTVTPGTLGTYVTVTINPGGSLASSTPGAATLSNKIILSGTGAGGSEVSLSGDQSLLLNGSLSGNGTLSKSGAGVLILSGTNTFTGGSEVRSGTLEVLSSHALGEGSVEIGTVASLALTAGSIGTTISIPNAISGSGELLKSGSGLVVLTGTSNAFTGRTNIESGTLEIRQSGALGSGLVTIGASANLAVNVGANEHVTLSNNIAGDGYLVKESQGTLTVGSKGNQFLGTRLEEGVLEVASGTALGKSLALNGGTLSTSMDVSFTVPVKVGGNMTVAPAAGSVTEMSGGFSGNGVLTKAGAGVLQISGILSVSSGMLEVVNAQSGAGGIEKAGSGTLLWSGSGTVRGSAQVSEGTLQMSGEQILRDVTKLGLGKMEVLGNSKFLGTTVLQAGTVVINNNAALSEVPLLVVGGKDSSGSVLDVTAVSGGLVVGAAVNQTLKGRGTILGSVSIDTQGYLAPGNSIGTLTVGTLSFNPGSFYEAEYLVSGGSASSDLLRVQASAGGTGVALLNGGYVIPKAVSRLTDFNPHSFAIMSASVGVVGRFTGVFQSAAIAASLAYLDASAGDSSLATGTVNTLKMVLQRVPYETLGGGGVGSRVGAVFDANLATSDATVSAMLDQLDALQTIAQVQAVLGRINPRAYAEVYSLAVSRLRDVQRSLSDRLSKVGAASVRSFGGPALAQGAETSWSAWTNVYGSSGSGDAQAPSLGGSTWNNYGNVTAVERNFGSLTFGFYGAVGSASEKISSPESTIAAESWNTGMYSSLPLTDRLFFDSSLLYGQASNVVKRPLPYLSSGTGARGETQTEEWLLHLGFGAQLAPEKTDWSAVLSAGFSCGEIRMGAVKETGVGGLGVEAAASSKSTALGRMSFELAKDWRVYGVPVRTLATVSWTHDFEVGPQSLGVHLQADPGNAWMVSGAGRSPDALHAGLSLEVGLSERRTLKIYGEQELQQSSSVLHGGVTFSIGF